MPPATTEPAIIRRPPDFFADVWRIARKDLLIEFRTRSAFLAAAVFAVLAIVIFRFTWDPTAIPPWISPPASSG